MSLLPGAASNKRKFLYKTSLRSKLEYFIHNMIGYTEWRLGRPGYNLVTSTSGLKANQMWGVARFPNMYYCLLHWRNEACFLWWNRSMTTFPPSQMLDFVCFWSWTFWKQLYCPVSTWLLLPQPAELTAPPLFCSTTLKQYVSLAQLSRAASASVWLLHSSWLFPVGLDLW